MSAARRVIAAAAALVLLSGAGLVEAVRIENVGLVVVLAASVLVATGVLLMARDRTLVALRADLATWAARSTAATGEPPEHLIDRAVSAYRARLGEGGGDGE